MEIETNKLCDIAWNGYYGIARITALHWENSVLTVFVEIDSGVIRVSEQSVSKCRSPAQGRIVGAPPSDLDFARIRGLDLNDYEE